MKQWLAVFAAVAFLALPIMVSASEETTIPPEAPWSPNPPTPGLVAIPQKRVVSTEQKQASDTPRPMAVRVIDEDATYQMVNTTINGD
jgi:hypothetical protein